MTEQNKEPPRIERAFTFEKSYISCNHCALNYSCQAAIEGRTERIFCQEFSIAIDPDATERNNDRALNCAYWVPEFGDRSKMSSPAPERKRWYERGAFK